MDAVNEAFVVAREELEYAEEDANTVNFDASYQGAKESVEKAVNMFESACRDAPEQERGRLQRSMGLKMEQLKVRGQSVCC